jgi:hypothetical protein
MAASMNSDDAARILFRIRLLHTAAWVVFATGTLAVPVALAFGAFAAALWASALIWVECAILIVNGMHCPLTGVAARYTADRSDNFDIFLPAWLARYNKLIFGTIFAVSEIWLVFVWWRGRA